MSHAVHHRTTDLKALKKAQPRCLDDQHSSLLRLKGSLSFFPVASATSKLLSWNQINDCCNWGGVSCHGGYVIVLDLSQESISGGVDYTSILFELMHLESLNLAYNDFSPNPIPPGLEKLSNLTHLNFSNSGFTGQIPIGISSMKRLVSLDLSTGYSLTPLKVQFPDLRTLVNEMPVLEELYLDGINISMTGREWSDYISVALPNIKILSLSGCSLSGPLGSSLLKLQHISKFWLSRNNFNAEVPEFFSNFSSLTLLDLGACGLRKEFPQKIFQLPSLRTLDISNNPLLHGSFPEFPHNASLTHLVMYNTNFSGKLPESIGRLNLLVNLELGNSGFSGPIPSSVSNLTRLQYLDLSENHLTGSVPHLGLCGNLRVLNLAHNQFIGPISSLQWGKLLKLESLVLRNNSLNGAIPSVLFTLPFLRTLDLSQNHLTSQLGEFAHIYSPRLQTLDLSSNMLQGTIPASIFILSSLNVLSLSSNNFTGTLRLTMFQNLRNLSRLELSVNNLWVEADGVNSSSFPQVRTLNLASCNLVVIPEFLSSQRKLSNLDLSENQIHGKIPDWLWKIGGGSLSQLNLSSNFLESPDRTIWNLYYFNSLVVVDLHSNMLQGQIPILPPSAVILDYSRNNFTSIIPVDLGSHLQVAIFFSLLHNSFSGEIPLSVCDAAYLHVLDLSNNNLSGLIPQCLSSMLTLNMLNLRNNNFRGSMMEEFAKGCHLRTLDLNGNRIQGRISRTLMNCTGLSVLDLGNNQLDGTFPSWLWDFAYLRVLVLRSNKFHGPIIHAKSGNNLPLLQIIDFSSNYFTGNLPTTLFSSWRAMMSWENETEANYKHGILRYLSDNQLSGAIPAQLEDLTFLSALNLSQNQLVGRVPQGRQFQTFSEALLEGNERLCGPPLSKICMDDSKDAATTMEGDKPCSFSMFMNCHSNGSLSLPLVSVTIGFGVGLGIYFGIGWFWGILDRIGVVLDKVILNR